MTERNIILLAFRSMKVVLYYWYSLMEKGLEAFRKCDCGEILVRYEELVATPQQEFDRVSKCLGLTPGTLSSMKITENMRNNKNRQPVTQIDTELKKRVQLINTKVGIVKMQNQISPSDYFKDNADSWLLDAFEQSGYNYPTPYHRLRVLKNILSLIEVNKLMDLGCGGGQIAIALAKEGINVHGVDQSEEMISIAKSELSKQSVQIRDRITFECKPIEAIKVSEKYDAVTAMGLIGYLGNDELLFEIASRSLRDEGYFIVSFRNRLFNLFSISHRTIREVEEGNFNSLVQEASEFYHEISIEEVRLFLSQLHAMSGLLLKDETLLFQSKESPSTKQGISYTSNYEARQTTPKEAIEVANRCGFKALFFRGIHPHFAVPGLNQKLAPQVYNRLSDSLIPLEAKPISLLWSSIFIGVFQKK